MTMDVMLLSGFILVALIVVVGVIEMSVTIWNLRATLETRELFIRQLLDRLATHEYAKADGTIPRVFATLPPSIREEAAVSGPHGSGQNVQLPEARSPSTPGPAPPPKRTKRTFRLDTGEEFRPFEPPGLTAPLENRKESEK